MKFLKIKGTKTSFGVELNAKDNVFEFSGSSRPENAIDTFNSIFEWFDLYFQHPNKKTVVSFNLDYFNTSTTKQLFKLFLILSSLYEKGFDIKINWYYKEEDVDMLESGKDFAELVEVPFCFIVK